MTSTMNKHWVLCALCAIFVLITGIAGPSGAKAVQENTIMEQYQAVLEQFPLGVMSTEDGDQPLTRVFQYLWSGGDKTYFRTDDQKDVYGHLPKCR